MSRFTPSITKEFNFDGDVVKVKFNRLRRIDFFRLSEYFGKSQKELEELGAEKQSVFLALIEEILLDIIISFSGLTIEDEEIKYSKGDNADRLKEVFSQMYFLDLTQSIIVNAYNNSVLKYDDDGKEQEKK